MNKRLLAIAMASALMVSMTACDNQKPAETTTTAAETTTEETTTAEETITTSEETTAAETTTASEETTTTSEETTSASSTTAPEVAGKTKKTSDKPTYIPKGWTKEPDVWGAKYKGKKRYVISKQGSYKGWYNGKWVKLYYTQVDNEEYGEFYENWYLDKKHKKKYAEHDDAY